MAAASTFIVFNWIISLSFMLALLPRFARAEDVIGCGGFIKSLVDINFSLVQVNLYTKNGILKYQTDCAPNNGYYMLPVYDKGEYILSVEAPPGWTFDPHRFDIMIDGKHDMCSRGEDVNFQFTGFGITGNVISMGQASGPSGVLLSLKKIPSQEILKDTLSTVGGNFTFQEVMPGEYLITASHPTWVFETSSVNVRVMRETGNAGSSISVAGFEVRGQVLSDGEPLLGVYFILFSPTEKLQKLKSCDMLAVKGMPTVPGYQAVCAVKSSASGWFSFSPVPSGRYVLVPFYKGDHIKFDVLPENLHLSVEHDSVEIGEPFRVAGFTVSGFIRTQLSGHGVANAKVFIDGKLQATTDADGKYHLDSMTAGSYKLHVDAPLMIFDVSTVKISPNAPQLPDIYAARFKVCGKIIIDKLPEGLNTESRTRSIVINKANGELYLVSTVTPDGTFCADCQPGKYRLSVDSTNAEKAAGLRISPEEMDITVVDEAILDIKFSQFAAQIRGSVHCLGSCGNLQLSLSSVGRSEDRKVIEVIGKNRHAEFIFEDVMPGKYKVVVLNDQWCWKPSMQDIVVIDKDLPDVNFIQTGFNVSYTLSHDITLKYEQVGKPENVESLKLTKGVGKFCLSYSGIYDLYPLSCHKFEQDVYQYDTSRPTVLILTAAYHVIEGVVTTQQPYSDIVVTVNSSVNENSINFGPLKLDSSSSSGSVNESLSPPFRYKFQHLAKTEEELLFSASSGILLFQPSTVSVTVHGDSCMGVAVRFEGRPGVFIEGEIHPAVQSVLITITSVDLKKYDLMTDENGRYRVGPLDADQEYNITALKEGYVFTRVDDKPGYFRSCKLGEILVEVFDDAGTPIVSALLSLSGSNDYRSNNVTQDGGSLLFTNLTPGQYFLKPIMKEYKFNPSSQIIDILDGTAVRLRIAGKRVSFSCYGSVLSLNGEPEAGVFLEAVEQPSDDGICGQHQEETKTELDGTYRIRGLQPKCEYLVRVKNGFNSLIERSTPSFRRVLVINEDVHDVDIVAVRRVNQMDISGTVVTPQEYLSTLKVQFYKEADLDTLLQSVSLSHTAFFFPTSVAMDNQTYVVRLSSTVSRSSFDYTLDEVQFVANSSYKHITLSFNPQAKAVDQELGHSSFVVLPLAAIILYLACNFQQVFPLLNASLLKFNLDRSLLSSTHQATNSGNNESSDSEVLNASKRKIKAKKIQ